MNSAIEQLLSMSKEERKIEIQRRKKANSIALEKLREEKRKSKQLAPGVCIEIRPDGSRRICHAPVGPELTEQSNAIGMSPKEQVEKFLKTGQKPTNVVDPSKLKFGDFTKADNYQDVLNIQIQAQESLSSLPSSLRERFRNDPAKLMEFCLNPKNKEEMDKLGMLSKEASQALKDAKKAKAEAEAAKAAKASKGDAGASKE